MEHNSDAGFGRAARDRGVRRLTRRTAGSSPPEPPPPRMADAPERSDQLLRTIAAAGFRRYGSWRIPACHLATLRPSPREPG